MQNIEDGTAIGDGLLASRRVCTPPSRKYPASGRIGPGPGVIKSEDHHPPDRWRANAGENCPTRPRAIAKDWGGIRVYTIGIGAGVRVRDRDPFFGEAARPRAVDGQRRSPCLIAETTGGVSAQGRRGKLRAIYREIDQPEKTTVRNCRVPPIAGGVPAAAPRRRVAGLPRGVLSGLWLRRTA